MKIYINGQNELIDFIKNIDNYKYIIYKLLKIKLMKYGVLY